MTRVTDNGVRYLAAFPRMRKIGFTNEGLRISRPFRE